MPSDNLLGFGSRDEVGYYRIFNTVYQQLRRDLAGQKSHWKHQGFLQNIPHALWGETVGQTSASDTGL